MERNRIIIRKKCFRKIKKIIKLKIDGRQIEKCIFIEWNIYRIEIKRLKEEKKEKFEVYKFSKRDVETEKYIWYKTDIKVVR